MNYDFSYISYGAGVQSTALLILSALGELNVPKAEVAFFADTGDEPQYVYDYIPLVEKWLLEHDGPRIITCSKGHKLSEAILDPEKFKRRPGLPAWTKSPTGNISPLPRTCTRDYKIDVIRIRARKYMGYMKWKNVKRNVRCMLGISVDEASRMKPSRTSWLTNEFPLVDANLSREDCFQIVKDAGLPAPKKSSCVFCPYHSDRYFKWLKTHHPEDFDKAAKFDKDMKIGKARYSIDGNDQYIPAYIHHSMKPLGQIDFSNADLEMFNEECEGYCGL